MLSTFKLKVTYMIMIRCLKKYIMMEKYQKNEQVNQIKGF